MQCLLVPSAKFLQGTKYRVVKILVDYSLLHGLPASGLISTVTAQLEYWPVLLWMSTKARSKRRFPSKHVIHYFPPFNQHWASPRTVWNTDVRAVRRQQYVGLEASFVLSCPPFSLPDRTQTWLISRTDRDWNVAEFPAPTLVRVFDRI